MPPELNLKPYDPLKHKFEEVFDVRGSRILQLTKFEGLKNATYDNYRGVVDGYVTAFYQGDLYVKIAKKTVYINLLCDSCGLPYAGNTVYSTPEAAIEWVLTHKGIKVLYPAVPITYEE